MRKNVNIVLLYFALFFGSMCVFAQDTVEIELLEMGGFIDKESPYIMNSRLVHLESNKGEISQNENKVFIHQIGSNNNIETNVSSPDAIVNLVQEGNENRIYSNIQSPQVRQNIIETGDNNSFFSFSNSLSKPVTENVHLNGNNNHVEKYGSNSITNKMEFNVQGNSKALIIRSYK